MEGDGLAGSHETISLDTCALSRKSGPKSPPARSPSAEPGPDAQHPPALPGDGAPGHRRGGRDRLPLRVCRPPGRVRLLGGPAQQPSRPSAGAVGGAGGPLRRRADQPEAGGGTLVRCLPRLVPGHRPGAVAVPHLGRGGHRADLVAGRYPHQPGGGLGDGGPGGGSAAGAPGADHEHPLRHSLRGRRPDAALGRPGTGHTPLPRRLSDRLLREFPGGYAGHLGLLAPTHSGASGAPGAAAARTYPRPVACRVGRAAAAPRLRPVLSLHNRLPRRARHAAPALEPALGQRSAPERWRHQPGHHRGLCLLHHRLLPLGPGGGSLRPRRRPGGGDARTGHVPADYQPGPGPAHHSARVLLRRLLHLGLQPRHPQRAARPGTPGATGQLRCPQRRIAERHCPGGAHVGLRPY